MASWIKALLEFVVGYFRMIRVSKKKEFTINRTASELIRNTHSIEKGLSIENPRIEFGKKKHQKMFDQIDCLLKYDCDLYREIVNMSINALREYTNYHREHGYLSDYILSLEDRINSYPFEHIKSLGGRCSFDNVTFSDEDITCIERLFNTRHSIRDFSGEHINEYKLDQALELAQTAPSACNRQAVRVYVLSNEKTKELSHRLEGIGGFADSVDRFIVITGKFSYYRENETFQFAVSSSIYAANLLLTLHMHGIAACIIQRNLCYNREWNDMRKKYRIPDDEQIVCLIAVGMPKQHCYVPRSHRLSRNHIVKYVD